MIDKQSRIRFRRELELTCNEIGYTYHESWKKKTITLSSRMKYLPTFRIYWEGGCYRVTFYTCNRRVKPRPRDDCRKKRRRTNWTLNNERKLTGFPMFLRMWVDMRPARHDEEDGD